MAEMLLNLDTTDGPSGGHAEHQNSKHQRFLKRRKFLEKRGYLKQKQLPQKTPNKKKEEPANSWAHSKHNGQHRTDRSHSNFFCPNQQLPPSERVTTGAPRQSGTLTVSIGPNANHSRVAAFTPSKGHCSSKPAETGHPTPRYSHHQKEIEISLVSEIESGIPSDSFTHSYKIVAIDCEMVGTGLKGSISALARCSIVGYNGDVVYDRYIKPASPITDYRTKWSGIRREHLFNAIPFSAAQKEILKILHGKLVIGHAIHNDYKALEYFHPKEMTRDTSKIPLLNRKAGFPDKEIASLKRLAKQILRRDIQVGRGGHSSVEDARTTMELYRIVEVEYERELASSGAD